MSQHYYPTTVQGQAATLTLGFDRPLQGFFCLIEIDGSKSDTPFYCNLDDPELAHAGGLPHSLDYFVAKLLEFDLTIPPAMVSEVINDALGNVGNRQVWYGADGAVLPGPPA